MSELFPDKNRGAIISPCGTYRYQLWRIWDESKPAVLWVMLNPSTADADQDDPTIRRCIAFARDWGYGGIYVGNLFALRATDPKELNRHPVRTLFGLHNGQYILEMAYKTAIHVLAFGAFKRKGLTAEQNGWMNDQIRRVPDWQCLGKTKDGAPMHPLYVPKCFPLIPFKP